MKIKFKKIFFIIFCFFLFFIFLILIIANYKTAPFIIGIEKNESKRYENQIIFNIEVDNYFFKFDKRTWCYISSDNKRPKPNDKGWIQASNGYCSFTVSNGEYDIYVKDKYGNINDIFSQKVQINKLLEIKPNKNIIYMYKGRTETLNYELFTIGNIKENIIWKSDNENVATIDIDGKVTAIDYGTTFVKAIDESGKTAKVKVVVSKHITKPIINSNKKYISCNQFSQEEAEMLDSILFDRIDDAGYGTRAGVVAAARFLTLEFSYRVHYFYENGRLNNYEPYKHVDGEGRYYHRGLYLSQNKFKELSASFVGPEIWGCDLQNYTDWGPYITGKYYPNGLDCSGFVTWALLNGGFDIGDIGAGENELHNDLDDLGTKVKITDSLLNSGKVKAGDLIGLNGHMAILAGWDDNNYYIAESLNTTGGVVMTVVEKNKLANDSIYKYIILMDDVYKNDGNYSYKW